MTQNDTSDNDMRDIEQYTWKGDTWFVVEGECPECGNNLTGNGKIKSCPKCKWWEPLSDTEQATRGDGE